jgi:hypothetical protein
MVSFIVNLRRLIFEAQDIVHLEIDRGQSAVRRPFFSTRMLAP